MDKQRSIYIAGFISILTNTLLFVLKYWVGMLTGSIAIIADSWHTLSDSITSLIVITGNKISRQPADEEHPFGHGRIELIAGLVIGVILAMVSFSFFNDAVKVLKTGRHAHYNTLAVIVITVSVIIKEALARYSFFISSKVNSKSLKADGWHHRSDALSSLVVLAGIFFSRYFWWTDGFLGIVISLLIMHTSYEIIREAVMPLLGVTPDKKLLDKVRNICREISGSEIEAHHFHLHEYGDHRELTFHIKLPGNISLGDAHRTASAIEQEVRDSLGIETTIHMEPSL